LNSTIPYFNLTEIFSGFGHLAWSKDIPSGQINLLTENFGPVFEVPQELIRINPDVLKSCIHPDDQPFSDTYSKYLLSNGFEELEYRIITPSGKIKWLQERKILIKNPTGEIIRLDVLLTEITETKKEEARLLDSEATFKSLFYRNPNPMWVYDTESLYFLAVNEAAVAFYGYTHDEFFRMTIRQIRPHEDVDDLIAAIRSNDLASRSERVWRHLRKDGSNVFVKLVSSGVQFRGNQARLVLANDVTKQVEAESQMEKVYRYLERFQEAVSKNSLLAFLDQDGKMVFINESLLQESGQKSEHLVGKAWTNLLSHPPADDKSGDIQSALNEKKLWRGELRFARKNGFFWVRCSFIPILYSEENPAQYLLIADDISSLKTAEKTNRDYAIRLYNILEALNDAIFVLDKNWHITNMNAKGEKLFGKRRKTLVGKNIWEVFPNETATRFFQFFRKARKRNINVEFEEYYEPKNEWYEISIYPSREGLTVCFRNVSRRRKEEEERKELIEHLNAQNQDLEEFTFITSHSLRAQIANISMLCAAIDGSGLTPSNQEIFEKLFQSSANLDAVIEDLNTILTIKDRSGLLFEKVEVNTSLINAINRIPYSFSPFKKCIHTNLPVGLEVVTVRNYLETILIQILTNALKFRSLEREPDIQISGRSLPNQIEISILDNGRGMDKELVGKQIFHLYKTFHQGVSGKGLGLYLCKILMDELNGSISIESKPDEGTLVTLRFPVQPS
jgi:PAS domain S-box-containing protein